MKANIIYFLLASILLWGCNSEKKKPPIDLSDINNNADITVPYEDINGIKVIPVKLNGITINMIYDTGCSGIHISLHELQTLYKNGKFSKEDIIGATLSQIADGSIVENGLIILREVEIGGENGLKLQNIEASVSLNQAAPILLGNGVLDELASVEVNNTNKVIIFKKY